MLNSSTAQTKKIRDQDKIDKKMRDKIRQDNNIKITAKESPVIKVSIEDMQEIIDTFKTMGANTLIFYLGSYKDPASIKNYNDRNKTNFQKKDFDNKPTFIIGANVMQFRELYYDAASMCPPPADGSCN